jgi:DNA (cytosine-5)-methyltransferase 1
MNKISVLELFAGIGGIRLGFEFAGAFDFTRAIEISPTARLVYARRFPDTPIWDDVQTFNGKPGEFDCIIGGSPCQDLSACGNKAGLDGERSSLWWQQLRIIEELKPKFIGWENVEGALSRGAREVVAGLRMVGYEVDGPVVISAAELGAPHLRKRIFIVAHRNDLSLRQRDGFTCWEEQLGNQITIARNYSYTQSQRWNTGVQFRENWGNKSDGIPEEAPNTSKCQQRYASGATEACCDTTGAVGKSAGVGVDDGISSELGRINSDAPAWLAGIRRSGWWFDNLPPDRAGIDGKRIKGRRECINHYGAACTPMQAVPMALRIKYLGRLLDRD